MCVCLCVFVKGWPTWDSRHFLALSFLLCWKCKKACRTERKRAWRSWSTGTRLCVSFLLTHKISAFTPQWVLRLFKQTTCTTFKFDLCILLRFHVKKKQAPYVGNQIFAKFLLSLYFFIFPWAENLKTYNTQICHTSNYFSIKWEKQSNHQKSPWATQESQYHVPIRCSIQVGKNGRKKETGLKKTFSEACWLIFHKSLYLVNY